MNEIQGFNRELSWLDFNRRVLAKAADEKAPVYERVRFLNIAAANMDEFFKVRMARLMSKQKTGRKADDINGLDVAGQLNLIYPEVDRLLCEFEQTEKSLLPQMEDNNIHIEDVSDRNIPEELTQSLHIVRYTRRKDIRTIADGQTLIAVLAKNADDERQLFFLTKDTIGGYLMSEREGKRYYCPVLALTRKCASLLLADLEILTACEIRPIRSAYYRKLFFSMPEESERIAFMEKLIDRRKKASVVRVDHGSGMTQELKELLCTVFSLAEENFFENPALFEAQFYEKIVNDLWDVNQIISMKRQKNVKDSNEDLFGLVRKEDLLLHHPYDSFETVLQFLEHAAEDPEVSSIWQTIYRVPKDSRIIAALKKAVKNGKKVTVLIELRARFDEEHNLNLAKDLKNNGVRVILGPWTLKTHCKMLLIAREEAEGRRYYAQLGTGNYHEKTAEIYTDMSLLTADPAVTGEVYRLFELLKYDNIKSMMMKAPFSTLLVAPQGIKSGIIEMIRQETENARAGKKAEIVFKCNALTQSDVIGALYEASQAGVRIRLIVRGLCSLIPGREYSSNIQVISHLGNYLEHARIYAFYADGEEKIYAGSADMMGRNLNKRVEVLFPVRSDKIKDRIKEILRVETQCKGDVQKTFQEIYKGKGNI